MGMLDGKDDRTFSVLLRQYRLAAGQTQEALAASAGLGTRSIQRLERGESQPQRATAHRLARALALTGEQRAQFEALAQPIPRRRVVVAAAGAPRVVETAPWDGSTHNLPLQLTSFIGRERELAAVSQLLGTTRLLTLTGTGGTGKTRLALQVAAALLDRYPDGVWHADLAALADPADVPTAVASAMGVREEAGQPLQATLVAALRSRHLLLVLDNCEHLLDVCATLAQALLRGCPQVTVLATSREGLRLAGEIVWRVPSMALPDDEHLPPPEALAQVEAVRLFVERALAVQPDFAVAAQNAPVVAQVCRRLDGIPLALELAAARLRGLSIEQLAARLDQRFRLLTGGSRAALARQQTLQATVEWSYGLLSAAEQTLFTRLAIFSGGFALDAAEAVCAGGQIATEEVLDLLLRLVDKSLVVAEGSAGDIERYRLLETLRQYGRERLLAAGETEDLHARHAAYYRALAEEAEPALFGPQQAAWLDRLEAEHVSLRQALRWAYEAEAAREGLRLAGALYRYWNNRGYLGEGIQWLTGLLALPGAAARMAARAKALTSIVSLRNDIGILVGSSVATADSQALLSEAVSIARETGDRWVLVFALGLRGELTAHTDYPAGRAMLEECLALCRELDFQWGVDATFDALGNVAWELGDTATAHTWWAEGLRRARQAGEQHGIARLLRTLGMLAYHEGDYATAHALVAESLAGYRALPDRAGLAITLGCLGAVAGAQGDTALARGCFEEKLALWRAAGDRAGIAAALAQLGALAQHEGDPTRAQALFEEALTLWRALADGAGVAASLAHLGGLAAARGDHERAALLYQAALDLPGASGDRAVTAVCLEGLAALATAAGRPERAARLYGAAVTQRQGIPVLHVWDERVARDRQVAAVCTALGDERFAAAWAKGQAMTLAQAIAYALTNGVGD
jgi:predicted ATPase/transcriptional regulator with XRE-family HTH domain